MRQIFVVLVVGIPLVLAAVFIASNALSNTFPLVQPDWIDESQAVEETYQAGLNHCLNNYESAGNSIASKSEYEKCIQAVEDWHNENIEK